MDILEKKYKKIELRSEEVQEIMGEVPSWVLRNGITAVFLIIISLLIGSYFFKYPDVIQAEIIITAAEPPVNIIAHSTGKIDTLFVKNKEHVSSNTPLGVIQNTANTMDVLKLKKHLQEWRRTNYSVEKGRLLFSDELLKLGVVQNSYSIFLSSLKDFIRYRETNYFSKKITTQRKKLSKQEEYRQEVFKQRKMVSGKVELASSSFERDSLLYVKGIISKNEYEQSRSNYLQNKQSKSSFEASLRQTELQVIQGKEILLDLQQRALETEQKHTLNLRTNIEELLTQLEAWEQQYLLIAPLDGIVNQMEVWSKNQNVNTGEVIFTVTPNINTTVKGKALLPIQGAGKVKLGQRVNVRVNNFPDQEFGYLIGEVESISKIPTSEGYYILKINFPEGLKTNYEKYLPTTQEMRGSADIITEDLRVIERFFMPIKKILKQQQ